MVQSGRPTECRYWLLCDRPLCMCDRSWLSCRRTWSWSPLATVREAAVNILCLPVDLCFLLARGEVHAQWCRHLAAFTRAAVPLRTVPEPPALGTLGMGVSLTRISVITMGRGLSHVLIGSLFLFLKHLFKTIVHFWAFVLLSLRGHVLETSIGASPHRFLLTPVLACV